MAAAQQNIDKSVTLEAQKKTGEDQWESVKQEILSGFVSEDMDKTAVFSLPAFDAVGKPITYRVVESSVTMKLNDGNTLTVAGLEGKTAFSFENQFKDEYTITYSKDSGDDVITNSLKGKVNLKIIKAWSNGAPEESTTVTFKVFRNNEEMLPDQLPEGTALTMTGNNASPANVWEIFIEGLDKYDQKGAPYEYSVQEIVPAGYWADYSYSYSTNSSERMTVTATVTNYPQGNGPSIYVRKKWLDDGDESSRKPVQVGLFQAGQDAAPLKKVTLTAAGKWEAHIAIPKDSYEGITEFNDAFYNGYYIKELAAVEGTQEMPVTYEGAATSPVGKLGELKTSLQVYQVSTEKNTKSAYIITNLRVGTLSVVANKVWVDGNNALNTRSNVTIKLTREPAGFTPQSIVLDGNKDGNGEAEAWQAVFTGLDKYDERGVLYQYRVSEEGFTQPVDHAYSKSIALQRYVVGLRRTGDVATYQLTNRLSETYATPKVHKIWMDNGQGKRPDIYLTLYRSYTKTVEGTPTRIEYEPMGYIEHRWDTTNNFHWICIFKSLPRYTPDGYEYTYYVKEEMPIRGVYKTHNYEQSPVDDHFTSEGKTATTDGYAPMEGTIVNRREDTRDINGVKIWKNIPLSVAMPKSEYPTAEVTLQYLPYVSDAFDSVVSDTPMNYQIAGVDQKQSIENRGTTFEFLDLPKYDLFGREIQYLIEEKSINGYESNPPQVGYFTLTNTYQADGPERTIHGTKSFSGNLMKNLDKLAYPKVEIEIYRQMQTAEGTLIGQKVLVGTASVSLDENKTEDFYQGHYSMDCLTYAPNGQPYRYFVKEKPINGYNANTAEQEVGDNNIVDFANEYTGGTTITISGTKTWNDQSDFYHTRPGDVALTLQRRTGTNSWEDVPGLSVEWVKGTETDNQWSYRFEHASLTQYAPNGAMYDYRVKEAAVKGYGNAERIVAASAPSYTANLVNTLDTTQLKVSKSWMYSLSNGSTVPIDYKESYGILPGTLTFEIQRTITPDDESSYEPVTVNGSVEVAVTGQAQEYLYQNLPKYDANGNAYTYRAREVKVGSIAVAADKAGAFTVVHSDGGSESILTTTVTNTIDAIAVYLQTEWIDASNQDGLRPTAVEFTLTASNGQSVKYDQSKPASSSEEAKWPALRVLVPKYAADGTTLITYGASQAKPSDDYSLQPTETTWESAPDYDAGTPVGKLFAFQNIHTPKTITLNVEKKWEEFEYSGYRPSSITLQLQKSLDNGSNWFNDGAEVTLTDSEWSHTWAALPAKVNASYSSVAATGTSNWIRYRVVEPRQLKYLAPTYSATYVTGSSNPNQNITVTNKLETTSVIVIKSWQDSTNQYLSRPTEADGSTKVVMELQRKLEGQEDSLFVAATDAAGNQLTATLTTEKDKDTGKYKDIATHTWSGLPVYNAAGVKYEYRVKETMMGSYAVSYTNSDTLSAGSAYNYDVTYAKSGNTFTVTNKVKAREGTMQLTVKKDWIDNNNQDGVRPAGLTVDLYRDGQKVNTVVLNSGNSWQHTFTGLPRYVGEGAEESSYSAEEGAVSPYVPPEKLRLAWNSGNSTVTFENLYNPKTMRVTAKKSWADDADWHAETRPESLKLTLKVKEKDTAYQTVTVDQAGAALINPLTITKASGWANVSWNNLPQKKNGVKLEYIVEEESVPGYASSASPVSGTGVQDEEKVIALTNRLGSITHTVEKHWLHDDVSGRPSTVTVALYRKTATTAEVPVSLPGAQPMTFDLTAEDHWAHTWSDLPPCDQAGAQYTYSARETHIGGLALDTNNCAAGYERVSQLTVGNKTTIENSLIRHSLTVQKHWEHGAYPMNIKHVVVQLQRQQPGASWADMPGVVREIALGSSGAEFSDLPVYSLLGEPYHYRAVESKLVLTDNTVVPAVLQEEDPLTGRIGAYRFSTVVEDYKTIITNQLITVGIQGEKIWDDEENYYAQRPGQIDLTVLNAGAVIAPQPNVDWIKTGNRWSYQISGLPRYNANGAPAVYSVREAVPPGYTAINNPASGLVGTQTGNVTQANLTNQLSTFSISGQKQWVDQANKFGLRPQTVTLIVKCDGAAVSPQPLASQIIWQKSGDVWNYTILGLPKPASVQDAQKYTVDEVVPEHYTKTQQAQGIIDSETFCITGANLTNTLDTGTLKLTKTTVAPQDDTEFSFTLRTKNLEGNWVLFKGMYNHIDSLGNSEARYTDDQGTITLKGGKEIEQETFELPALASTEYEVIEEAHPDYVLTRSNDEAGALAKNGAKVLQFENTFQSRLAIENDTTNPTDHSRKNVGGKITVVTGAKDTPDQPEVDDYKDNQVAVAWVPDEYYALGRALTLFYRPAGSSSFQMLSIPEYLNESGEVKPITDPVFAPLLAVYPNANISKTGAVVKLTLSNNPAQMPADTRVHVLFIPTLAVENTTQGDRGGTVMVENGTEHNQSDGDPDKDGSRRYTARTVLGKAASGFSVDMTNLTLGLPKTQGGDLGSNLLAVKILPDAAGRFSATVPTMLGGVSTAVQVSGTVHTDKQGTVTIEFDELPIPLDVGIAFKQNASSDQDEEQDFWENVGELVKKGKPGDTIHVRPGDYTKVPKWLIDLVKEQEDIGLEIELPNGKIVVISSKISPKEIPGAIYYPIDKLPQKVNPYTGGSTWEISAPGVAQRAHQQRDGQGMFPIFFKDQLGFLATAMCAALVLFVCGKAYLRHKKQ